MLRLFFLLFFGLNSICTYANYQLIYFKTKFANSSLKLSEQNAIRHQKRGYCYDEKDLEVNPYFVQSIQSFGVNIIGKSRWLNAVCVEASTKQIHAIQELPFVLKIEKLQTPISHVSSIQEDYPGSSLSGIPQLQMLGIDRLHKAGFNGKDINIAVIDNGFTGVDQLLAYKHVFQENRIKHHKNFVDPARTVFQMSNDGEHGSRVFSMLAALQPPKFIGAAYGANYFLAVTEDMKREGILEEWNWLMAAEWADSLGADIISTSLGYATNFTYGSDHTYEEMDGKTNLISRAANLAASRGILVVNSAGNEGNLPWRHMIAPADADSCLAVGSVDIFRRYSPFSSQGPNYLGLIKPDISAMGGMAVVMTSSGFLRAGDGTSFACPLISGLAACIWQSDTTLSNMDLFQKIKQSGHLAQNPDTFLGWGIPHADTLYYRISGKHLPESNNLNNYFVVFPNPSNGQIGMQYFNYAGTQIPARFQLFNQEGQLICDLELLLQKEFSQFRFDLRELNIKKGMYYLRILGLDQVIVYENKLAIIE